MTSKSGDYVLIALPDSRDIRIVAPAGQVATMPVNGVLANKTMTPKQKLKDINFGLRAAGQQVNQVSRLTSQRSQPSKPSKVWRAAQAWSSVMTTIKFVDLDADMEHESPWTATIS